MVYGVAVAEKGVLKMLYPDESFRIMGACFAVHNQMGSGFLEAVYQECLEIEFESRQLPGVAKSEVQLKYGDRVSKQTYEPDFICYEKIILEIKACDSLVSKHGAQVLNYLNATGYELGLLVNFGAHPRLQWKRFALSQRDVVVSSD